MSAPQTLCFGDRVDAMPLGPRRSMADRHESGWGCALISHFRPHLATASLVCMGAALLWRARLSIVLCMCGGVECEEPRFRSGLYWTRLIRT